MARLWQLKFWVLIVLMIGLASGLGVVLTATLLAGRSVETWNREYVTWHASQLEAEFWRMLEAATRYGTTQREVDRPGLDLRIDVFVSRITIFDGGIGAERLRRVPGASDHLARLKRVFAEQEPSLRALAPGDPDALNAIHAALVELGPVLKQLTVSFEHYETTGAITAVQNLQGYFYVGAILVAALIFTGIVLVVFLFLEIRVRRRLLESTLASQEQARVARQREEATLIEAGRRFRTIALANPVALIVCDVEHGSIRYANPAASRLLGLSGQGQSDKGLGDFFANRADFDALVRAGIADQHETRLRRVDGTGFPAALSARALDYDGAPCLVIGVLDLTEIRAAQTEIERQREVIYHREKLGALGSLLAGVAHELNNPLSIVVAQATLLEELATDTATATRGSRIRVAAERCARIVKTFLAMARQRPPSRASVSLNDAATGALELLGYGLRSAGIEVRADLAPDLPAIWADPDQISQVVTNLIVNAQQALADWSGPRRLDIATRLDPARKMVELRVVDSGPGVPAELRSRIFEPFFTTKPVGVGTGIGLSVSHGVIVTHGGTIEVEDNPGGGAAFIVRLPPGSPASQAATTPAAEPMPRAEKGSILIVDDEPEVAQTIADILTGASYRIDVVESGQAALDRVGRSDYAVILSDIRMPGMDGMEFYRRLRTLKPAAADRLVLVTGDALSPGVSEFLEETGLPRIEKPFIPSEVRRLVASVAQSAEAVA